jgi:hypothetical protein
MLLVAAAKILAVEAGTLNHSACQPCLPKWLTQPAHLVGYGLLSLLVPPTSARDLLKYSFVVL